MKEKHPPTEAEASTKEAEEEVSHQLQAAETEAKGHYEKLLRVMAEFENFKRRSHKELEERVRYGNERLLADLLPTLDDLDRVIDHLPQEIQDGGELLRRSLQKTLEKYDLKEIQALGEIFDPTCHEAMATAEGDASNAERVVEVHRKGYWLGERLLRASLVTVAKKAESEKL